MQPHSARPMTGILLAAGKGMRFDRSGIKNKLTQVLPCGESVIAASAKTLHAAVPAVIVVVRPGTVGVIEQLQSIDCRIVECPWADEGMAASLVHALSEAQDAEGWVIALADMPYVQPATITALAEAIRNGADIAVPTYRGQRGNPVAFSRKHLPELLRLTGDEGARRLLATLPVIEIATQDAGICMDIDTAADLA
jgi:molybdenum cofactor cytidylyltransferase